jgi:hypothetical protein
MLKIYQFLLRSFVLYTYNKQARIKPFASPLNLFSLQRNWFNNEHKITDRH